MENYKPINPNEWNKSPFATVGKTWMLVTAEKGGTANTMTASWGGFGILWGKPVAFIVVRPQRYTKQFVDGAAGFSLSLLGEMHRKTLQYLGSTSGRDENKIEKAGLSLAYENGIPYFEEAETVLFCKKLYAAPLEENAFTGSEIPAEIYKDGDYHTLYFAEVEGIFEQG